MSDGLNLKQVEILKKFRQRLNKEKFINHQSSVYYSKQNNKFVIPGIMITGIASVASFLSTSDMFEDNVKQGSAIGVGILTAGATILQSVSTSFGFKTRADAFQKSADCYDDLLTKIEFEIVNPNEDFNEFCNDMESEILKIKADNKFFPPLHIQELWEKYKQGLFVEEESLFSVVVQNIKDKAEEYGTQELIEKIQETKEDIEEAVELAIETNETIQTIKQEHENVVEERKRITQEAQESHDAVINVDDANNDNINNVDNSRVIDFVSGNVTTNNNESDNLDDVII